jgi:hypothetical protein
MNLVENFAAAWTAVLGVVGLVTIGLGIYWLFNRQARLSELAEMRKRLDELQVSDPEYGAARVLYTSMVGDAERWGFFLFDGGGSDGHGGGDHHGSAHDHGGGYHSGDGGAGGGGHH